MLFKKRNARPTVGEVAQRLLALECVAVDAHAAPSGEMLDTLAQEWTEDQARRVASAGPTARNQFWAQVRARDLWRHLSPAEREYASIPKARMSNQVWLNALWRIESAPVLAWALGLLAELPAYDTPAKLDQLDAVPHERIGEFIKSARLRPQDQIDRARDVAEAWHWRSRTRQLIETGYRIPDNERSEFSADGSLDSIVREAARQAHEIGYISAPIDADYPARAKAYRDLTADEWSEVRSITTERHFALNWVCGYAPGNRWDETPTET